MAGHPKPPAMKGLRKRINDHRRSAGDDSGGFVRQQYCLSRDEARLIARQWFDHYPKAAYWTVVESWRVVPDGRIEFAMRRLSSAD